MPEFAAKGQRSSFFAEHSLSWFGRGCAGFGFFGAAISGVPAVGFGEGANDALERGPLAGIVDWRMGRGLGFILRQDRFHHRNRINFLSSLLKPKAGGAAPALLFSEVGLKGNFKFWGSLELKGEVIGVDSADQPLRENARNRQRFVLERLGDEFRVFGTKSRKGPWRASRIAPQEQQLPAREMVRAKVPVMP